MFTVGSEGDEEDDETQNTDRGNLHANLAEGIFGNCRPNFILRYCDYLIFRCK